ncbi:unnamed protein product [Kuraishia capsulata CBS 1993]|uniref:Uncharacterized protein n=1 Tax=Kuraishia capsulata CBS 1993 TaxID=1382522 RepID=W6MP47_9ASCO|nr:uncharacterized protein KUCA_T00002826001 [Kuraishia capsulata CBS 1993]CDK26852.1 unnamed protein product [Kuraishia capsulata CBS 1993]
MWSSYEERAVRGRMLPRIFAVLLYPIKYHRNKNPGSRKPWNGSIFGVPILGRFISFKRWISFRKNLKLSNARSIFEARCPDFSKDDDSRMGWKKMDFVGHLLICALLL